MCSNLHAATAMARAFALIVEDAAATSAAASKTSLLGSTKDLAQASVRIAKVREKSSKNKFYAAKA